MHSRAGRNDGIVSTYRVLSRNYTEAKMHIEISTDNNIEGREELATQLKGWWRAA